LTQREKLGYLEGGTHALIHRLSDGIRAKGGKILTGAGVEKIAVKDGRACGVVSGAGSHEADAVVATVPFVTLLRLIDHERAPYFDLLRTVEYIGVVCVLLRLKARFTHFFWTNINEPGIPLAGIVEYTNLNPCPFLKGSHLLYLPMYLPHSSPRYTLDDQELVRQCAGYLHAIRPDFDSGWIEDSHVFRSKYAQPICPLGFRKLIAPVQSPVPNLFVTDSSQLHPHDRTIANSIELGQRAAALVLRGRTTRAASPSSPA
jgi:protoporphyrinogen oxidase